MENEKLVYTTALFRGFKRLQDFALDPSAHYENIEALNEYLNPTDGRKSTAYPGQIVSIYNQPDNNGVYFVVPGEEGGFTLSEKFATQSQIEELTTQVSTAIANMVVANPDHKPVVDEALETVKIADKTYKLVKAIETEVEDAKNLYAIEIAGVTYNLKTNLDDYVTKKALQSIVGSLDQSLDKRIDDIETILGKLIDADSDESTIDKINDIIAKLEELNPDILDIMVKVDDTATDITYINSDISTIKTNIININQSILELQIKVDGNYNYLKGELEGAIKGVVDFHEGILNTIKDIKDTAKENKEYLEAKIDDHINNLYSVKRVKSMTFTGPSEETYYITADGETWLSAGDIVEQVSVSIAGVPANFREEDYTFKFVVNNDTTNPIINEDDIIFDEDGATFEFSFNKRLKTDINSAGFTVKLPEGAVINALITYVILEKRV